MTRSEWLIALALVAAIAAMWQLGMYWAQQQGRRGLAPAGTIREVIP